MRQISGALQLAIIAVFLIAGLCPAGEDFSAKGVFLVEGKVLDSSGNALPEVDVALFRDGGPFVPPLSDSKGRRAPAASVTGNNGLFSVEIHAPPGEIEHGQWSLRFTRPSFKPSLSIPISGIHPLGTTADGVKRFSTRVEAVLERDVGPAFWIALVVLVGIYVLVSFEVVHRTLAALIGAAAVLAVTHTIGHFDPAYRILTFEQSLKAVDWNVIFLLMGMMVIVGVLKESGLFQWLAYKSFQVTRGRVFLLAAALSVVTAILSAFLDNVTTMLLLTPVTIEIALVLGISPYALLLPEIMASNFGGTATLIGDPPNIMIGSYAGLTFNDFVVTLTPVVIVTMAVQILYTKWYYGRDYEHAKVGDVSTMLEFLREKYRITDYRILCTGLSVLAGVILLFILHGFFHMEVAVAALLGAALILILNKVDIVEVLERDVEWPSLVFFIMLFVVVGAAEETGILHLVAEWLQRTCGGSLVAAVVLIVWTSAVLSAIVDNIPFTATMLPVVALLNRTIPGAESGVLWWALALGACFGGNGTIIGASANVITVGMAEKAGHHITFLQFLKHGGPVTALSLVIATAYLLVVFT